MKVGICSLGCKVNIYESEYVYNLFKKANYEIVPFDSKADIYIINPCSVTNEADRKSRQMISRAKRSNKEAIIVVMGCYSQVKSGDIEADIVIGNKDKSKIVSLVEDYIKNNNRIKKIYNLREIDEFESMEIDNFDNHTRAFVKIQDGCNAFCSYCIIPYTRGQIRSKKPEEVIREVCKLVKNGYKEIILTGIHTGKYGLDLDNYTLYNLLSDLVQIEGIYRIRLSSIEINELTDEILELVKNSSVLARHFHIPLQSGSDKILKLMNRKYDIDYFINKIEEIRSIRPDIAISTDIIVGFPGEGEEEFLNTLSVSDEIKFSKIHVFPYSKRNGTKAAKMPNQVDNATKKDRARRLIKIDEDLQKEYYDKFKGKTVNVLIEEVKKGISIGHTENFIKVEIPLELEENKNYDVKVIKTYSDYVDGELKK